MRKYKFAIIGCGNIAGGYDNPGDKRILTHAHAINVHDKATLAAVFDIDGDRADQFAKKWGTTAFHCLEEVFSVANPDIVVVAVNDEFHVSVLEECLQFGPQAVICEKPLGQDIDEARVVLGKYQSRNIPIAVNYSRCYDYAVRALREDILKGVYGDFLTAWGIYTKGILHNGSHIINLLVLLFGEIEKIKILDVSFDYSKTDPNVELFLRFANGYKCHLLAANEKKYSIFEVDLFFGKRRITLWNFGLKMRIQSLRADPLFPGYKDMDEGITSLTGLNKSLLNLIDNVINHLEQGERLFCSGDDALRTEMVCHKILSDLKDKGNCD